MPREAIQSVQRKLDDNDVGEGELATDANKSNGGGEWIKLAWNSTCPKDLRGTECFVDTKDVVCLSIARRDRGRANIALLKSVTPG